MAVGFRAVVAGALVMAGVLATAPVSVLGPARAVAQSAEETAVGEVFVRARTALQDRDGAATLATLSRADQERVERIRDAALEGRMASLAPSERFAAMGLRHYMKPAEIRKRDAAALVEHALEQRWLDPTDISRAGLAKVRVDKDRATGTLVVDQKPQIVPANFIREQGRWRVDLSRTLQMTDALIATQAMLSRKSEDQVIVEILERTSGRKVAGR
jgi:hypothetical protein